MKRTRRTNAPKPMPPDIANKAVDIIIVGAGGSGLATAVSAAEHGASVLVLEKQSEPGGTTAMAVGSFTAADTSLQKEAGVDDSVEAHAEDAGKFPPPDYEAQNNDALRRHFLEHASDTFEWLRDMGLDFHGPSPEPPNRAPRMHNVVPAARAYIYTLRQRLQQLGGELICDTPVTRIAKDNGRVTGVEATVNGRPKTFHAAKGVVLAAGDYAHAPDLIARFKGDRFASSTWTSPTAPNSASSRLTKRTSSTSSPQAVSLPNLPAPSCPSPQNLSSIPLLNAGLLHGSIPKTPSSPTARCS